MANSRNEALAYYKKMDNTCPNIAKYSRNLNLLWLKGQLDPCYHRDTLLIQIQKTLLRKNKANVLLTGPAGCGKTALAEGLAAVLAERRVVYATACAKAKKAYKAATAKWEADYPDGYEPDSEEYHPQPEYIEPPKSPLCDCVIYDFSLNALISGTRYRGEFEERLQEVLNECRANRNIILFCDEIHHIATIGKTEGSVSMGQILKPALARNEIRIIGATTTEEKEEIFADKALARRFSEVEVLPLTGAAAEDTAQRILDHYCRFHKIRTEVSADTLLTQVQCNLSHGVFPDHFINVVDETLAGAAFDGLDVVDMTQFQAVLARMTGETILCDDDLLDGTFPTA